MKNAPVVVKPSLVQKIASRFAVDPEKLLPTLKATAFRQKSGDISNEQMMALLIVADQYGLNPFTKEIYAYPDKQNGIVPVVSVDGWTRIINGNTTLDGISFSYAEDNEIPQHGKECPIYIDCRIKRKDRADPIIVREYLDECYRAPFKRDDGSVVNGPWQSHTKRMLRHKALIQCSRVAFGFAGIYDEDEAKRLTERDITDQGEVIKVEGPRAKSEPPPAQPSPSAEPSLPAAATAGGALTVEAAIIRINAMTDPEVLALWADDLPTEIKTNDEFKAIYIARQQLLKDVIAGKRRKA